LEFKQFFLALHDEEVLEIGLVGFLEYVSGVLGPGGMIAEGFEEIVQPNEKVNQSAIADTGGVGTHKANEVIGRTLLLGTSVIFLKQFIGDL